MKKLLMEIYYLIIQ